MSSNLKKNIIMHKRISQVTRVHHKVFHFFDDFDLVRETIWSIRAIVISVKFPFVISTQFSVREVMRVKDMITKHEFR